MNKIIPILSVTLILLAGIFILMNPNINRIDLQSDEKINNETSTTDDEIIDDELIDDETSSLMTLEEAREIAENSHCVDGGDLEGTHTYNSITGTYWFDLSIESEGCNPACVVDVNTRMASINWRCTGLIME